MPQRPIDLESVLDPYNAIRMGLMPWFRRALRVPVKTSLREIDSNVRLFHIVIDRLLTPDEYVYRRARAAIDGFGS